MTDLPALLTRLRAATGPDRTLDADICVALAYVPEGAATFVDIGSSAGPDYLFFELVGFEGPECHRRYCETPALTRSIDAAVDLMQRMLPGAHRTSSDDGWAQIEYSDGGFDVDFECDNAATEPLAILVATIEALMAREGSDE